MLGDVATVLNPCCTPGPSKVGTFEMYLLHSVPERMGQDLTLTISVFLESDRSMQLR